MTVSVMSVNTTSDEVLKQVQAIHDSQLRQAQASHDFQQKQVMIVSIIVVIVSIVAAISFGMYNEKEKIMFKDLLQKHSKENKEHFDYVELLQKYNKCNEEKGWDATRDKVHDECQKQARCSIEELNECRQLLDKVKTNVSEFEKGNVKGEPCTGIWCTLTTIAGLFKDATA